MSNDTIQAYIREKLSELDAGRDMNEVNLKGRLSFGMEEHRYKHLPAWKGLVNKKKRLVRMVWLNAALASLVIVAMLGDVWDKFELNWSGALAYLLASAALIMLFQVIACFYSIFYFFRLTEREVRKLIYQDIAERLEKQEATKI